MTQNPSFTHTLQQEIDDLRAQSDVIAPGMQLDTIGDDNRFSGKRTRWLLLAARETARF